MTYAVIRVTQGKPFACRLRLSGCSGPVGAYTHRPGSCPRRGADLEALRTAAQGSRSLGRSYWSSVAWLLDELGQVERLTELADQAKLDLQVVDVLFLVGEDALEDVRARDVADAAHVLDAAP